MSVVAEKLKIMVVDTSTAMLHVLKNFSDKHGYESDSFSDPAEACIALSKRFEQFDADYRCVLLGWPDGSLDIIDDLLGVLASVDHQDLPVLIVCQEMTTEIKKIVKRRARTRALLWKDYQAAAELIDRLALTPKAEIKKASIDKNSAKQVQQVSGATDAKAAVIAATDRSVSKQPDIKALLLDNAPSVSRVLRDMMESNGYQVTLASSVSEGRKAVEKREYDLVVTDFFLRGEGGEEFCRYLQSAENLPGHKPVCVVISSKYSDAIVKRSLAVGAISCLYKDESTELLFARIDALVRALPVTTPASVKNDAVAEMLELANDPAVLIDHEGVIAGLNTKARRLLDDINKRELVGREFSTVALTESIILEQPQKAGFLTSSGSEIAVAYMAQHVSIKGSDSGVFLTFNPQPVHMTQAKMNSAVVVETSVGSTPIIATNSMVGTTVEPMRTIGVSAPEGIVNPDMPMENIVRNVAEVDKEKTEILPVKANKKKASVSIVEAFNDTLGVALSSGSDGPRHCLLVLDIQLIAATGDRLGLGHSKPMLKIVTDSLASLYTRDKSFTYLGDGQFGFVLANRRMQDTLVLTQKLLRIVPQLVKYLNNMTLVCHGAVLQLADYDESDTAKVLDKCRRGCIRARLDNKDNAVLVMPMNKYLAAESSKPGKTAREQAATN